MKKLIAAAFVISAACNAHASDIGGFIGITYVFGANAGPGITLQATSTRREDHAIAAAGVSLYPFGPSPKFASRWVSATRGTIGRASSAMIS